VDSSDWTLDHVCDEESRPCIKTVGKAFCERRVYSAPGDVTWARRHVFSSSGLSFGVCDDGSAVFVVVVVFVVCGIVLVRFWNVVYVVVVGIKWSGWNAVDLPTEYFNKITACSMQYLLIIIDDIDISLAR